MRSIGYLLLVAAGILCLPLLLGFIHPFWWNDWFGDANSPRPSQLAAAISYSFIAAELAVPIAIAGVAIVVCIDSTASKDKKSS